jgi:hypothetical protein
MGMHITLLAHDQLKIQSEWTFIRKLCASSGEPVSNNILPFILRERAMPAGGTSDLSNQPRLGFGVNAVSAIDGMISRNTADVRTYIEAAGDPSKLIAGMEPITQIK